MVAPTGCRLADQEQASNTGDDHRRTGGEQKGTPPVAGHARFVRKTWQATSFRKAGFVEPLGESGEVLRSAERG
jgi:hypothetical protein